MVSPKIDLYKLKEEEWIKYKRMDKLATHETRMKQIIAGVLLIGFLMAIVAYTAISATPSIHSAASLLHSATMQLNRSFNAAGIGNLTIYNNTVQLTNHLAVNPNALASFVTWMYAVGMFLSAVAPLLIMALLIFIIYFFFATSFSSPEIYSFKYLRRRLASLEHIRNTLRAHGFSEQEIDWYYEVKEETRKLLIKIGE
jgi:hypothetical protein